MVSRVYMQKLEGGVRKTYMMGQPLNDSIQDGESNERSTSKGIRVKQVVAVVLVSLCLVS